MAFNFTLAGHASTKEAEAQIVAILHDTKKRVAQIADEASSFLSTTFHGAGSTGEVADRVEATPPAQGGS